MKNKIAIILLCLGFTSVSAFAGGFGVSGDKTPASTSQNTEIAKLLAQAQSRAGANTMSP
jgi:hypothetical protein